MVPPYAFFKLAGVGDVEEAAISEKLMRLATELDLCHRTPSPTSTRRRGHYRHR
jgi:hypothetical protein